VPTGRYVLLTLSDTGVGMDAATQRQAFEPFFTTKPEGQGTGLGLATVYGIVKQSAGYVSLSSEPGKGTIVEVYLGRVDEEPEVKIVQTRRRRPRNSSGTILLVEDYPSLGRMVRIALEKNGYTVISAANGADALDIAKRYRGTIHLLITDVIMPGMHGPQLAEHILQRRSGVRVLYMSGYPSQMLGQHGMFSKVAFIKKPFTLPDLLAKIRVMLESTNVPNGRLNSPAASERSVG